MSVESNKEPTRDQTTQDFLTGLKEREELKSKLHEKERECNTLKGIVYDMTKKIENLEKQETKKARPVSARRPKRPAQKKREKKDAGQLSPHTNIEKNSDNPFEDPEKLYQEIATRYPDVPLSTVLIAEKKFVEADLDRNGTIDKDELGKMLDLVSQQGGTGFLYTKNQVEAIFRKIDLDKTNSIDFFECIEILEMMRQKRVKDLPIEATTIQQNKSAVCNIQ